MYRFLKITPEETFGVFDDEATTGRYIRMDAPNIFKPMQKTNALVLPDPLINRPLLNIPTKVEVGGKLTACVYVEDAPILLGMAGLRINSGRTAPWPTLLTTVGDIASATFDFGWAQNDGATLMRKRYLGVKATKARVYCAGGEGNDPRLMVDLDLLGQVVQGNSWDASTDPDATAFPEPVAADYSVLPYLIYDLVITVAAAQRANCKAFNVEIDNMGKSYFDTRRFAQRISSRGRKVTWGGSWLEDGVLVTDRTSHDAQTAMGAATAVFTHAGASVSFDFKTLSRVQSVNEDLPMDEDGYFEGTNLAFVDTGVDMALTIDAIA
jgi:hypothetical protein